MAKNPERRRELVDAGLRVLAAEGSRGLTHRAVDAEAGLPQGTCVNYLRSRAILYRALGERIFERLTPTEEQLDRSAAVPPSRDRLIELMHELLARVCAQPDLQIALLELRLEATRQPELQAALTQTLTQAFELDVAFQARAGLPGGRDEIVMLHLAIGGLILNLVTLPNVLGVGEPPDAAADLVAELVRRLVPQTTTERALMTP